MPGDPTEERRKARGESAPEKPRVLLGTVGYQNLQNHSLGPILYPELARSASDALLVEELNWGPVAIVQRLQAEKEPFSRIVLVSARPDGRPEGTLSLYRWRGGLPPSEQIQARIAESVTGVINVDNLLIVGEHFQVWPRQLFLVDVAPGKEAAGPDLRPAVQQQLPLVLEHALNLAQHGRTSEIPQSLAGDRIDCSNSARVGAQESGW